MKKAKIPSVDNLAADLILYMTQFMDPSSMYQFSQITPYVQTVFSTSYSGKIWTRAAEEVCENVVEDIRDDLTPQQIIQLIANRGCESCGKKRIRKVYWPFGKRLCLDCVKTLTISDYRLEHDFKIPSANFPLYYISRELWSKTHGTFSLDFYLISDVESKTGKSLAIIRSERHDLSKEFEIWLRERFSNKKRIDRCKQVKDILSEIADGDHENLTDILTDEFINSLDEKYAELTEIDKAAAKQTRKRNKLYKKFDEAIQECKSVQDIDDLHEEIKQSEFPWEFDARIYTQRWNIIRPEYEAKFDLNLQECESVQDLEDLRKEIRRDDIPTNLSQKFNNKISAQIRHLIGPLNQNIQSSEKIFPCYLCDDQTRLFTWNGLDQHSYAKHGVRAHLNIGPSRAL